MHAETRFVELLPVIDEISRSLCRRRRVSGVEAEDFAADVRARFVETSYAPLCEFRGESSLHTYLAVVIGSWLKDMIVARDGRWRPSAVATRLGVEAVRLERLLVQGGRTVTEAVHERLASGSCALTERELRELVRRLPTRSPLRPLRVAFDDLKQDAAYRVQAPDAELHEAERARTAARYCCALRDALNELPAEDRRLVVDRFLGGRTLAQVARSQNRQAKPLYRQLARNLDALKRSLMAAGLTATALEETLG